MLAFFFGWQCFKSSLLSVLWCFSSSTFAFSHLDLFSSYVSVLVSLGVPVQCFLYITNVMKLVLTDLNATSKSWYENTLAQLTILCSSGKVLDVLKVSSKTWIQFFFENDLEHSCIFFGWQCFKSKVHCALWCFWSSILAFFSFRSFFLVVSVLFSFGVLGRMLFVYQ